MALVIEGATPCALCGEVIKAGDDVVMTSTFIADERDELWPFSDAGMHRSCFLGWKLRATFVARYNEAHKSRVFGNGTYFRMRDDGVILRLPADSRQL